MSGTRKMDKFELDAFAEAHAEEREAAKPASDVVPAAPADGAAPVSADLPARPFEPRMPPPPLVKPTHETTSGPKPARASSPEGRAWHEANFADVDRDIPSDAPTRVGVPALSDEVLQAAPMEEPPALEP